MFESKLFTEAKDRITRAKTALITKHPFYSIIALSLKFRNSVECGLGDEIDTMATDGIHVWYHPEFTMKYSLDEIVGVVIHETLHVVLMHMLRRGIRDPLIWNIAGDAVINQMILGAGIKLPPNGVFLPKYKGWTTEATYNDMVKDLPKLRLEWTMDGDKGGGKGKDGDGKPKKLWGTVMEPRDDKGNPLSEAEKTEMKEELRIRISSAAEAAKAIGKLPGGLEFLIEAIKKPTVDWQDYIAQWVKGIVPDNYTWRRPNRSIMANYGVYMPSMELNGAGNGVLSIDNSGSVSDKELVDYITNIVGIIEKLNPSKLWIIQHDSRVQKIDEWEPGMDFNSLKIKGRGGTCIRPVFDKIKEFDEDINWMICFTDMEINDFPSKDQAPDFPVLWAATGADRAPFGTYIPLRDAMAMGS